MRCFIAADFPEEVKDYLEEVSKKIIGDRVKYVEKEKYHITLGFIGKVSDEDAEKIKSKLRKVAFKPFEAELSGLGFFPNEGTPKVFFISIEPRGEFKLLNQKIKNELKKMGIKLGKFEPHVTLARAKFVRHKKELIKNLKLLEIKPLKFKIDNFKLKRSYLTSEGSFYKEIANFDLF